MRQAALFIQTVDRGELAQAGTAAEALLLSLNDPRVRDISDECPDPTACAELGAGLAVVRNAALMVRRLFDEPVIDQSLLATCRALVEQSQTHLSHFRAATETT
jgi:hypothetical protein